MNNRFSALYLAKKPHSGVGAVPEETRRASPGNRVRRLSCMTSTEERWSPLPGLLKAASNPSCLVKDCIELLCEHAGTAYVAVSLVSDRNLVIAFDSSEKVSRQLQKALKESCHLSDPQNRDYLIGECRVRNLHKCLFYSIEFDKTYYGTVWLGFARLNDVPSQRTETILSSLGIACVTARMLEEERVTIGEEKELLVGASHDLTAPTQCALSVLREAAIQKTLNISLVEDVEFQLTQQIASTRNLIDLLRQEVKRSSHNPGSCRISEHVSETLRLFNRGYPNARIEVDLPEPLTISFDPNHFKRILWNLLANGVRHGGANIHIDATYCERLVQLHVKDRGPGVTYSQRNALFTKRANSRIEPAGGYGIGLYVSKWLATLNEASLKYEDRSGGGSVFTLSALRSCCEVSPHPCEHRKLQVLIIDDEMCHCRMVKRYLSELSVECSQSFSKEEALKLLGEEQFDVIIADYWIGSCPITEVLLHPNTRRPRYGVLLVSGGEDSLASFKVRFTAIESLQKPICREELTSAIRRIVAKGACQIPTVRDA